MILYIKSYIYTHTHTYTVYKRLTSDLGTLTD